VRDSRPGISLLGIPACEYLRCNKGARSSREDVPRNAEEVRSTLAYCTHIDAHIETHAVAFPLACEWVCTCVYIYVYIKYIYIYIYNVRM